MLKYAAEILRERQVMFEIATQISMSRV
jgi:hypothetical protein